MEKIIEMVAWPATAALVSIVALLIFRAPIAALINRTKRINGKNSAIDFDDVPASEKQRQEQQKQITNSVALQTVAPLAPPSEVVAATENDIRRIVDGIPENDAGKQARLIRALAISDLQKDFETIYRILFGSQLDFLLAANAGGVSKERAEQMFQAAVAAYPEIHQNANVDMWLAFPKNVGLLADDPHGRLTTTTKAKEFMQYLVSVGLTSPKQNG